MTLINKIKRKLSTKELMLLNCGVEEDSESPLDYKEIQPVHPKGNQSWIFIESTDAKAETPILWPPDTKNWLIGKDPDAGKLKAGGEEDDEGWDGGMPSLTWWMWVWASSKLWWPGKPSVLQSMGSQTVGHSWATELHWSVNVLISLGIGICCSFPDELFVNEFILRHFFQESTLGWCQKITVAKMFLEKAVAGAPVGSRFYQKY